MKPTIINLIQLATLGIGVFACLFIGGVLLYDTVRKALKK